MFINENDQSFGFKAPAQASNQVNDVMLPYCEKEAVTAAATTAITAKYGKDVKDLGTLAADTTVNATINSDVVQGSELYVKVKASASGNTLTPGTGFTGKAQTLTASKTYLMSFMLINGTYHMIANTQLD